VAVWLQLAQVMSRRGLWYRQCSVFGFCC